MWAVFNARNQTSEETTLIFGPGVSQLEGRAPYANSQTLEERVLYPCCRLCDDAVRLDLPVPQKNPAWIQWMQQPGTASTAVKQSYWANAHRNRKQFSGVLLVPPTGRA